MSHTSHSTKPTGLDSCNLMDTMRSEFENPPHDLMSSGSVVGNPLSDSKARNTGKTKSRWFKSQRTELIRMEEVVERLLDPYCCNAGVSGGGHYPNPYRPSSVKSGPTRSAVDLTATWCGELRVQNEALADENACAKEQTLRDLERLTAAGTVMSTGIRGSYNQGQNDYVATCSADMRTYALEDDDMRVPSFLRNRPKMPMRRMQVPGMRPETGRSCASSNGGSLGFLEMDLATINDYSTVVPATPTSVTSSEMSSTAVRGKLSSLRNSKVAKCVKGLKSWRRLQKQGASLRETPAIREDKDYDYSNESLSTAPSSLLPKGTCFMCLGGAQSTKHSVVEAELFPCPENDVPAKTSDVKSILLTTSPLYGDVQPTPRSQMDDLAYSTQHSLNIAATLNPTADNSSVSDSESEAADEERDLAEIWDDDETETESVVSRDDCPLKHWDDTLPSGWEPPTLKTDQEYEMYQLQSRMEAETLMRRRLSRQPRSPQPRRRPNSPSFVYTADEIVDTASVSSWDVCGAKDSSRGRRSLSHGSSSWSDFGLDGKSVTSARSDFNNSLFR